MTKIAEIFEYLKSHKDKPTKLSDLVKMLKSSTSTVSTSVLALRRKGHNIKSGPEGYLYIDKPSATPAESTSTSPQATLPTRHSEITSADSKADMIVKYFQENKSATPDQLRDILGIQKQSVYALVSQIKRRHRITMKNGVYHYAGEKTKADTKNDTGSPDALVTNFPWITMTQIMSVPEAERAEMFEAMRKELFYRKLALAFVEANRVMESTMKGVRI